MHKANIRVCLADDHPLIRKGIRTELAEADDIIVVGEADDGYATRRMCEAYVPDVLLLDLHMPGPPAVETVAYLQVRLPEMKVVILSAYDDDVHVREMVLAGVAGYILKDDADEVLIKAVRSVARGGSWYSQRIMKAITTWQMLRSTQQTKEVSLTARELLVLQLVVVGKTNQEIGHVLGLKEKTVEKYLRDLYTKLNVASRVEAAVWAVRHGGV